MSRERIYDIKMICRFCGAETPEKWFDDIKRKYINMCSNCSVSTTARKGTMVRYNAAVRDYSGAVYADHHLERGGIYTIAKTKPWIHGCDVYLQGFDHRSFHLNIFTPVEYVRHTERARAYPFVQAGFRSLGGDDRIAANDLLWYADRQAFAAADIIHVDDLATNHTLVLRKE